MSKRVSLRDTLNLEQRRRTVLRRCVGAMPLVEWVMTYWPAMLAGFVFATLFSLVREFWRRFVFSALLFLLAFRVLLNMAHGNSEGWDHLAAGSAMVGVFVGCLVRPGVAGIVRMISSAMHSRRELP